MTVIKDRYELGPIISKGGMGIVYRGIHRSLSRPVAIKFIHENVPTANFGERFKREAQAIARLAHPNIVVVHDFDHDEERGYFMVMELLDGITLSQMLKQTREKEEFIPLEQTLHIIRGVGEGLNYAHQLGIVHRDVKPSNVIITSENRVVVTDFGIAKMVSEASITGPDTIMGTPYYFAPEQATGDRVDHRVDIYALGAVFYEMLTNHLPYEADTTMSVIAKHINAPIPDPLETRPDLPVQAKVIIDRAMAKDASNRYPDVIAFLDDLMQLDTDEEKTVVVEQESRSPSTPEQKTVTSIPPQESSTKSVPLKWMAAGIIALVVLILAGVVLLSGDSDNSSDSSQRTYTFEPAREGEYLYLISEFEREDIDIERRIADGLTSSSLPGLLRDNFRYEQLDSVIHNEAEAEIIANDTGAVVVIWGIEDATGLELIFSSPLYPERTVRELKFLVPSGESFNDTMLDELGMVVSFTSHFLTNQMILRNSYFPGIDFNLLNAYGTLSFADMHILPSRSMERNAVELILAFNNQDYALADELLTDMIDLLPDDPMLYFLRYTVNGFFLDRPDRAESDANRLSELMPESALVIWADAAFALVENDYEGLVETARTFESSDPLSMEVMDFYEILSLIIEGDFEEAASLLPDVTLETFNDSFGFPTIEVFRSMLFELRGDLESAEEDRRVLAIDRSVESMGDSLVSVPFSNPPFAFIFWIGYAIEEANPTLSGLAYNFETPGFENHFLLFWRKAVMAERNEDFETASEYYEIAIENAPVHFPVASYQLARLVHEQGLDSEPGACELLENAERQANTSPEFYSVLIEKISAELMEFECP